MTSNPVAACMRVSPTTNALYSTCDTSMAFIPTM